jgi:linoleoyl-CoA desaturase
MWSIYGNQYDLDKFTENHPGGKDILLSTRNVGDITVLFETYHAFSDKEGIKKILEKYKIESTSDQNSTKQYDFTNYNKLLEKIKVVYKDRKSTKAPFSWYLRNIVSFVLYVLTFYYTFYSNAYTFFRCIGAFVAGFLWISIGFNVMHDGSHYGVSVNPKTNIMLSKLWNTWSLWNEQVWFYHHVYNHHSHTGVKDKDPDMYHFRPLVAKEKDDNKVFSLTRRYQEKLISFITIIFPGMFSGQIISYYIGFLKKRMWKIQLPLTTYYNTYELLLIIFNIYSMYRGLWLPTIVYFISNNLFYHINIAPDHDTFESAVENHYEGDDWLKLQVCNSGNFLTHNIPYTLCFGAINYQIEHHLFPNMSNEHYPVIAPIVKKYCSENNIPYTSHPTLYSAYKSYLKMIFYMKN